jgi:putative transposase
MIRQMCNLCLYRVHTLEWVDWFNNRRLLEPIGNIPPAEFELLYDRQQDESATAA